MGIRAHGIAALLCALLLPCLCGGEPREPGFNELIVIEPGMQEDGQSGVSVSGGHVHIAPTLHIHPYYYSGDKEYQGPIINGGATIIVAKHPKSGEKLYIDAVLPAGAPTIAYSSDTITYIYQDRRVVVHFKRLFRHRAVVSHVSGRGLFRRTEEHVARRMESIRDIGRKSPLAAELGELGRDTGNLIKGGVGMATSTGAGAVSKLRALTKVMPGVQALQSAASEMDTKAVQHEIQQAGLKQTRGATKFLPTLR